MINVELQAGHVFGHMRECTPEDMKSSSLLACDREARLSKVVPGKHCSACGKYLLPPIVPLSEKCELLVRMCWLGAISILTIKKGVH